VTNEDRIKLATFLRGWGLGQQMMWQGYDARAIAEELVKEVSFADIRVAGFLQTPDGAVVAEIVERSLPFPVNWQVGVMVEAIIIAARQRTDRERLSTLAVGGGIALVLLMLFGGTTK
jgi:hypothetical protein